MSAELRIITEKASVVCPHGGRVHLKASPGWVFVNGAPVMVDSDLEGCTISACPWTGGSLVPCSKTLRVIMGRSPWIKIDGRRVYLKKVKGLTNGAPPPGSFQFKVARSYHSFVQEVD
jgi:hypothetical protein